MADAVSFVGAIQLLKNLGLFDVILPVLLVYAVTFGILQRAKLFHKDKEGKEAYKELNASIALVIALLFVGAANLTGIIQSFMPFVGLISVLIVTFLMLIGMVAGEDMTSFFKGKNQALQGAIILITAIAFIFTFGIAAGWWNITTATGLIMSQNGIFTTQNLSAVIFLILIGLVILWITKGASSGSEKTS